MGAAASLGCGSTNAVGVEDEGRFQDGSNQRERTRSEIQRKQMHRIKNKKASLTLQGAVSSVDDIFNKLATDFDNKTDGIFRICV